MKKVIGVMLSILIVISFIGCGKSNSKEDIKSKIEYALKDKEVTSVDVVTTANGEPKALVQLKGDILKADVKKQDAIEYCKKLGEKIKPICPKYDIELDDKNNKLIIIVDQDGNSN